jgi:sugar transferase (PEP-CTERM/EpsH1 system associated)
MRRLKIAFLSQRVAYPPTRGDKIITWRMVERLQRHHDVCCVAFAHGEEDENGARELRDRGVSVVTVPFRRHLTVVKAVGALATGQPLTTVLLGSRTMRAAVASAMRGADVAVAFSSSMGAYLLEWPGTPRILHFCELDSDKWHQYAQSTRPPMNWIYAREARLLLELERRLAASMNVNMVCTPLEAGIFHDRIESATCVVLSNGIDLDYFSPSPLEAVRAEIVFTGVMDYFPNIDGCQWFVQEVLPRVAAEVPETHFTIVGSSPSRPVRKLGLDPRVTVTGRVPDTRPYLRRASIVVAPLRIARGIQNKVLEGMAMGVPVVATTVAAQGVAGIPGRDYVTADDAATMSRAIVRLLTDDEERHALGARGRTFVETHYSWEDALDPLERVVEQLATVMPA